MGIKLQGIEPEEALTYDRIFMDRLVIDQRQVEHEGDPPQYSLMLSVRRFAVDSEGGTHYLMRPQIISMDDVMAAAMAKAGVGDMDLMNAFMAIQQAVANIIEDETGASTEII